jgi:hypothetical protein
MDRRSRAAGRARLTEILKFVIPAKAAGRARLTEILKFVIPAKAGIHCLLTDPEWIPAFAGMTRVLRKLLFTSVILSRRS